MKLTFLDDATTQPITIPVHVWREWKEKVLLEHYSVDSVIKLSPDDLRICLAPPGKCYLNFAAEGYFCGMVEITDPPPNSRTVRMHEIVKQFPPWWKSFLDVGPPPVNPREMRIGVIDSGCGLNPLLNHVQRLCVEATGPLREMACTVDTSGRVAVGHGTHVVGLIAGRPRRLNDFSGCFPSAKVISVRVADFWDGDAAKFMPKLSAALKYLRTRQVDVINLSMSYPEDVGDARSAINEVLEAGIVVVAAAGNDAHPSLEFPARHPGVIAVAASGCFEHTLTDTITFVQNEKQINHLATRKRVRRKATPNGERLYRWSCSNCDGREIWVPGAGVYSTWPRELLLPVEPFRDMDGSSMACALASGTIARIMQREWHLLDTLEGRDRVSKVRKLLNKTDYRGIFKDPGI